MNSDPMQKCPESGSVTDRETERCSCGAKFGTWVLKTIWIVALSAAVAYAVVEYHDRNDYVRAYYEGELCYETGDEYRAIYKFRRAHELEGSISFLTTYKIGMCYKKMGKYSAAMDCFHQVDGYAPAAYELYKCYAEGKGVAKDPEKAAKYLRRAQEHGYGK